MPRLIQLHLTVRSSQETSDRQPRSSSASPPPLPSSFPLDEAVQSSRRGRSSGGGALIDSNISANARRADSYLQQLESYLAADQTQLQVRTERFK